MKSNFFRYLHAIFFFVLLSLLAPAPLPAQVAGDAGATATSSKSGEGSLAESSGAAEPAVTEAAAVESESFTRPGRELAVPKLQNGRLPLFGYDVFAGFAENRPAEVPLRPDYIVGPGDEFQCSVWGREDASFTLIINVEGEGAIPQVGPIELAGLTYEEMKLAVENALSERISDFRLTILPVKQRRIRVYVLGEAIKPGVYDVGGSETAYSVLFSAGGPSTRGSLRNITHKRGNRVIGKIDLYDFLLSGNRDTDVGLQEGDVIHIPLAGNRVSVQGQVRRPAIYELKDGDNSLATVMQMAGGPLPGGDIENVRVERMLLHDRKIVFNANLSKSPVAGSESHVSCCDQDIITLYAVSPRHDEQVLFEGHVFEPGPRPWKRGMKISDILTGAGILKRDPYLEYGEIRREVGHGGHIELLTFSPGRILAADPQADLLLQARDRIRILSRAEVHETPTVRINGEVVKPGSYDLEAGMTVRDLVFRAGGLKLWVDMSRCDFTRVSSKAGTQEITQTVIDLEKAMADKTGANPVLRAGDVVAVRALPDWQRNNIVRITGEVRYPGEYVFRQGERISAIVARAGGYNSRAYLSGAYFKRISALEQQSRQIDTVVRSAKLEQQVEAIKLASGSNGKDKDEERQFEAAQLQMLEQMTNIRPTGRLVVKIDDSPAFAGSSFDLELEPGDELHVPAQPATVIVEGAVGNPTILSWEPDKNILYYINQAGGFSKYSRRDDTRLVRADGSTLAATRRHRPAHSFLGTRVQPGDTIWVPVDMRPRRPSGISRVKDITQILGNLAITYIAVDNARDN